MAAKKNNVPKKPMDNEKIISSTETTKMKMKQVIWPTLYFDEEVAEEISSDAYWSSETVQRDLEPFLDAISELKPRVVHAYVLHYLLFKFGFLDMSEENQRELFAFAGDEKRLGALEGTKYNPKLLEAIIHKENKCIDEELVQIWWRIQEEVKQSFLGEGHSAVGKMTSEEWNQFYKDIIFHLDYEKLKDLALATRMESEQLAIFLTKVLKRRNTNFKDRKEVLLFLTLKYSAYGPGKYFDAYDMLDRLYPPVKKKKGKEESADTVLLEDDLDDLKIDVSNFFSQKQKTVEKYFARIVNMDGKRTAEKVVLEQGNQLKGRLDSIVKLPKAYNTIFTIEVGHTTENLNLPEGFVFSIPTDVQGLMANFKVLADAPIKKELTVPVRAVTSMTNAEINDFFRNAGLRDARGKSDKKVKKFVKNELLTNVGSKIQIENPENWESIDAIEVGGSLRYVANSDKPKESIEGEIILKLKKDTTIPAGTKFSFILANQKFEYVTIEKTDLFIENKSEVQVEWQNSLECNASAVFEEKKTYTYIDTMSIFDKVKGLQHLEDVLTIRFKKPVKIEKGIREQVDDSDYIKDIYDQVEIDMEKEKKAYKKACEKYGSDFFLLSQEFYQTELTKDVFSGKNLMYHGESGLRNYILTLAFWNILLQYENAKEVEKLEMKDAFTLDVNDVLIDAGGFQRFSPESFAYDGFLYLLLNSDDPLTLFKLIWNLASWYRESFDRRDGK